MSITEIDKPTPPECAEGAILDAFKECEEYDIQGAVVILIQPDKTYSYTYSQNLSDEQILAMATFVQTVQTMAFLRDHDD